MQKAERRFSPGISDRLVKDLKRDSDDFSFIFVPRLEQRLGVKVPVLEWQTVYTVQDAVDLLWQHYNHAKPITT